MKLYKLTDKDGYTYNPSLLWGVGVTHTAAKGKPKLCSPTVIHAYTSPLLAELMDRLHGNYGATKLLWEAEGDVVISDGLKVGVKQLTTVSQIDVPSLTTVQRVAFAIYCGMEVYNDLSYHAWAGKWLSGEDRSGKAAYAAAYAADAAAYTAADAAYTTAAAYAADAAAYTAVYAARSKPTIDFVSLAEKAMRVV